jgi:hypothetical protein
LFCDVLVSIFSIFCCCFLKIIIRILAIPCKPKNGSVKKGIYCTFILHTMSIKTLIEDTFWRKKTVWRVLQLINLQNNLIEQFLLNFKNLTKLFAIKFQKLSWRISIKCFHCNRSRWSNYNAQIFHNFMHPSDASHKLRI